MKHSTSKRTFTLEDQIAFAELSGDNNPVHVDPLAARRSMFGQPIAHGIHTLMWALDQYLEDCCEPVRLKSIQAAFLKPIGLNQEVRFTHPAAGQNNRIRIDVLKEDEIAIRLVFELLPDEPGHGCEISPGVPEQSAPDLIERKTIQACCGSLGLYLKREAALRLFPNLTRCFSPLQTSILLGTTRLVGVKCPGLHSIYAELKMAANDPGDVRQINYAVSEYDDRYGLVLMKVAAPGLAGTVKAFIRPPPQTQTAFLELKRLVEPGAFAGQKALIVGGSRGLGEVAAKLLAAGGAEVLLTYHLGQADAQKVAGEILAGGGQAGICELDALQIPSDWRSPTAPTELYYFASPHISSSSSKHFSARLFNNFCNYYVNGFAGLVEFLQKLGLRHVYYPSTVFIEEMPENFVEYTLAKHTGERLCQALGRKYNGTHFYCPRLPKMATDQTAGLQSVQNADPAPIILTTLHSFQAAIVAKAG